jgi:hypothetical protein
MIDRGQVHRVSCYLSFIEEWGKCFPTIVSSSISNLFQVRKELQWWISIVTL